MTLKRNQKIIIYLCLEALSVFLIERFLISGLRQRLRNLHQQIRLAEARLKKDLEIQKTKDKILADIDYCQPYLKMAATNEKQIIAELLRGIEGITRASGGSIVNLNPQEEVEQAKAYRKYKAVFRLEVNFQQLLNFLYKVQESKLLIKLDRFSVVSKDEQAKTLRVDGTVSMAVP